MRLRHLALVAAVAALPALSFGQGLAEAARKEQERRARAGAIACRALDESDLKTTKGQLANAANSSNAAVPARAESRQAPEPPASGSLAQDEANRLAKEQFWKNEASRRRQQLARLERDVQQAERWSDPTYAGPDAPS